MNEKLCSGKHTFLSSEETPVNIYKLKNCPNHWYIEI